MSDDKSDTGLVAGGTAILRDYGLGGLLLVIGAGLVGLGVYKGADFKDVSTQHEVVVGALVAGGVVGAIGVILMIVASLRGRATSSPQPPVTHRHDVFIAAPMAGFDNDEAGRKVAVELVNVVQAALRRADANLDIYTPILGRPDATEYETPDAAFDVELQALRGAKRYLLILPPALPAGTSVLVTAGAAIALGLATVILAHAAQSLPYLLRGAVQSRQVNVHLHQYSDSASIDVLIDNNGLRLFGETAA